MKRRIGKFYYSRSITESENAHEIFNKINCIPLRVEYLAHKDMFECIGASPLFDEQDEWFEPQEYEIKITSPDDSEIVVEAIKVSNL